ncbi:MULTISPECIES: carboxypeptidase-like regulatory domain-containing protein [Flavobacterium]|nr:carboxypeptidase-like regulatory domain-containing protein [Flavobacterium sp. N1846]
MKIYLIFFLLFIDYTYSQEFAFEGYVFSKETKMPIEGASITFNFGGITLTKISDIKGRFKINDTNSLKSVKISHLSYQIREYSKISDTIFYLEEIVRNLDQVNLVNYKNNQIYTLPFTNKLKKSTCNFSWNNTIAVFIPSEESNKSRIIKNLIYEISDFQGVKGLEYLPFKANLYSVDNLSGLPEKPILENSIETKKNDKNRYVKIDVSQYNLTIPAEGIFIVLEILNKDKYPTSFIQSKIGTISAVPAIKAYAYNRNYIRKSYIKGRYELLDDRSNVWVEVKCHYLMDVEF